MAGESQQEDSKSREDVKGGVRRSVSGSDGFASGEGAGSVVIVYPMGERQLPDHCTEETLRITLDTKGSMSRVPAHDNDPLLLTARISRYRFDRHGAGIVWSILPVSSTAIATPFAFQCGSVG